MQNKNKRNSIKEKRAYNTSDLKRKGDFSDSLKEVLRKKIKNNEGNQAVISQKEEKINEKGVIKISTSGKSTIKEDFLGKGSLFSKKNWYFFKPKISFFIVFFI